MASDPFEAAWQRWDRAWVHKSASVAAWNGFIDGHDAFDFVLDGDGTGTYILRVLQNRTVPAELAVALGEWLYNLRASLDYVIWATACYVAGRVPPPGEGILQYPIYDEEAAWRRNEYRLKGLHQHHREMLLVMQPFTSDTDANYLGWVNRLARIDRHRSLVTGAARLAQLEPVLQVPDGSVVTVEWGERTIVDGHADAARITVSPYRSGMEVSVNPRIGIDPEIAEWSRSPFWSKIPFDERLKMMQIFVGAEIATYEYDCTGHSRKAELLTTDFRAASDERRSMTAELIRIRPQVDWTPAGQGRASTRERFEGYDFPSDGAGPREGPPQGPPARDRASDA